MDPLKFKFTALHDGPDGCGNPAFLYARVPGPDHQIFSHLTLKLDGHQPNPGEGIFCGSCGKPLSGPPRTFLMPPGTSRPASDYTSVSPAWP